MTLNPTKCGCGAEIVFATFEKSLKPGPLDAVPSPEGNCLVDVEAKTYVVLSGKRLSEARASGTVLYTSHFKTCPDRNSYGKRAKKTPEPRRRRGKPVIGDQLGFVLEDGSEPPGLNEVTQEPDPQAGEIIDHCANCGAPMTLDDVSVHNDYGRFCLELACQRVSARGLTA